MANSGGLWKTGHTLEGWNTQVDGTGATYAVGGIMEDDISATDGSTAMLYATWNPNPYTIQYNGNGNTGGAVPEDQTKYYGATLSLPVQGSLVKTGYYFAGWNTKEDGTGNHYTTVLSTDLTTVAGATIIFYAKWTPITYTIQYSGNENTGGGPPVSQVKTYDTGVTLRTNTGSLTRTGYTFGDWNTQADGSGVAYAVGSSLSTDLSATNGATVTLYARWNPISYTIRYNGNGSAGGAVPADQAKTYGTSLTLAAPGTLARTGYTFAGWNTEPDGSGATYTAGSALSADLSSVQGTIVTLYAHWATNIYTIRYNGNGSTGGAAPADQTKATGTNLTLAGQGTLVKAGYSFMGWNTASNGSGATYAAGSVLTNEIGSANNGAVVTLYAKWAENVINLSEPSASTGYGWTYTVGVFTVENGASVKVTGSTDLNRVVVAANAAATLTLNNVSINLSTDTGSPIDLSNGATVTLILSGTNTITPKGSSTGINVPTGRTLTVSSASTGRLTVTGSASGSSGGAGIGGSGGAAGGTITISGGTITATGGSGAAGVGGGSGGSGGPISITATTRLVTATGGQNAAGIGGGQNGAAGTINIEWVADSLGYATRGAPRAGSGAPYDIGPGAGGSGGTLSINNTAISQWPTNQFVWPANTTINLSSPIVIGPVGYSYSAANHKYTVNNGASVTVRGSTTADNILVPSNATATITMQNASIKLAGTTTKNPIELDDGANLTLILVGNFDSGGGNYLHAAGAGAGIKVTTGRTLTIQGGGSLEAYGAPQDTNASYWDGAGAGIGGSWMESSAGTINIQHTGYIYVRGGKGNGAGLTSGAEGGLVGTLLGAAGIGGSLHGHGGTVNITSGWMCVQSYDGGAAIGGGGRGNGGTVNLNYPSGNSRGWAFATYSYLNPWTNERNLGDDIGAGKHGSGGTLNTTGKAGYEGNLYVWGM
jgi:uncharacterized repeat protein (TIGR02543 family)